MDLGLVNANDDAAIFIKTPEQRPRQLPSPDTRRPSSSYTSSTSPDLLVRQERYKPARLHSPTLSRSQTLPRSYPRSPVREKDSLPGWLDATLEPDVVERLRKWIISVIVGEKTSLVCLRRCFANSHVCTVNFDLDLGPVIEAICPPFALSTAEKENV